MKLQFVFTFLVAIASFGNCHNEFLAINCKENKIKQYTKNRTWVLRKSKLFCPSEDRDILNICRTGYKDLHIQQAIRISVKNRTLCEPKICEQFDSNYKLYKCVADYSTTEALEIPKKCIFRHTLKDDMCYSEDELKIKAENICKTDKNLSNYELNQFTVLFKCDKLEIDKKPTFSKIQLVCCPKLDMYKWYMSHLKYENGTVKSEKEDFQLAKKSLRETFKSRQKEIQDRFIQEEQSITFWPQYPKLAKNLEKNMQNKFKKKFMSEMQNEKSLLGNLEVIHENRMQKLFEDNRRNAKSRLQYTLQETGPQIDRIATALKLGLKSILSEAEDLTDFYEDLIEEDLDNTQSNRALIRGNFNSLVVQSWDYVLGLLEKVPKFKKDIIKQIKEYNLKKQAIVQRFHYLDNNNLPKNSMENQARNHVENLIKLYGYGSVNNKVDEDFNENKGPISKSNVSPIILICLACLSIMLLIAISLLLYRFHGKINSYLSNTFKKIHPPTKNLFVQIENYPFKNRYNYGNGIYQPYFKSEESMIGNPNYVFNQLFTSTNKPSNEALKNSVESNFNDSTISNINGLENPICRLLDEK